MRVEERKTANEAAVANYGFDFNFSVEQPVIPYDNEGACSELLKDMQRGDKLTIMFYKDKDGYACAQVESKNVSSFKVRLNPAIFSWITQYLETGKSTAHYDSTPMNPIETDAEVYKVDMLKGFVNGGKAIQWTPQFRERNGKLSGTHIAKYGKVYFYVERSEGLVDWLREMKQAI